MNKITNFLSVSLLLLGATAFGMDAFNQQLNKQLIDAASSGNPEKVQALIAQGALVDTRDEDECTPLMWAACMGHMAVCRFLIANNASIEAKDVMGDTPLARAACKEGNVAVCRLLIENNASVKTKNDDGWTPLTTAAVNFNPDVCKLFINVHREQARKNQAAIATFLGIVRMRRANFPCPMQKDIAIMVARKEWEKVKRDKQDVIDQINQLKGKAKTDWLEYVTQQMNSANK